MALTIIEDFAKLQLTNVYDPVILSSTLMASAGMRYVLDVSGTLGSARLKCDPVPDTKYGFFGINRIVETLFVRSVPQIVSAWQTGRWAVKANLTYREEYPNQTISSGLITGSIFAVQGYAGYADAVVALGNGFPYIITGSTGVVGDIVFSNRPTQRSLLFTTPEYIHAVVDPALVSGIQVCVRYYDNAGTVARTFYVTRSGTTESNIINVGGQALYNLTAGECSDGNNGTLNFPAQGGFYDYQLVADSAGVVTGRKRSQEFRVYLKTIQSGLSVNNVCSGTIYESNTGHNMVLMFQNEYGSFDTYEFTMKRRTSVNVEREQIRRNVDVYGFQNWIENNSVMFQYSYELNTDWLLDSEWTWLMELIASPRVYMHVATIGWMPIILQNNSYIINRRINDNLRQLNITALSGEKIATI